MGAVVGDNSTGGRWLLCDKFTHINALEMKAVEFGLKALCAGVSKIHIRLRIGNTNAATYIKDQVNIKYQYQISSQLSVTFWLGRSGIGVLSVIFGSPRNIYRARKILWPTGKQNFP